jgi:predicted CopG family antitoxin
MSKLINISDEIYQKLTEMKGKEMSYTFVIKNLIGKKSNKELLLSFAGKGDINEKEIAEIKKEWKKWNQTYV